MRESGLFVLDFGGDVSGPVILTESLLLIPLSLHYLQGGERPSPHDGSLKAESLGCDSGSFVFLQMTSDVPSSISNAAEKEIKKQNGIFLDLLPGRWELYFEQFEAPQENMRRLYRNIVLSRE